MDLNDKLYKIVDNDFIFDNKKKCDINFYDYKKIKVYSEPVLTEFSKSRITFNIKKHILRLNKFDDEYFILDLYRLDDWLNDKYQIYKRYVIDSYDGLEELINDIDEN